MYVTGTDIAQVERYFARQPLPVLEALRNKLRAELLDGQAAASFAVLLQVIATRAAC